MSATLKGAGDSNPLHSSGRPISRNAVQGDCPEEGFLEPFERAASDSPERILAWGAGGNRSITLGQARQASLTLAAALRERGVVPGDRVAVMAANGLVPLIVGYALARAGAVWLALDQQHSQGTIAWQLGLAEPVLAIADAEGAARLRAAGLTHSTELLVISDVDDVQGFVQTLGSPREPADAFAQPPTAAAPLLLISTSGTTGRPKLAIVTHRMLRLAGQGVVGCAGLQAGDVLFVWEPLSHIGGAQLLAAAALCGAGLWITDGFEPGRFWEQVHDARATHIHYLGGILNLLAAQPPSERDNSHGVRIGWGAGANPELAEIFHRRFGMTLRECYGLTEAASISTFTGSSFDGSLGRPAPWAAIAISDPDGCAVAAGESGEIVITEVRSPYFAGYFADPEATAAVFRSDGLHTGDRGYLDAAGRVHYQGRLGDVFRCRGQKVSAWEVEKIAAAHPDVGECALTAVPGEFGDQDLVLTITTAPGRVVELPDLVSWLRGRLGPAALPRYYRLVVEFPRTPSQRIMKARLPSTVADCHDRFADLKSDERRGTLGQIVERAWRRVLGPDPGRWPSFTAAGGDSIAWVKMVRLVQDATGQQVPQDRCHPGLGLAGFLDALTTDPGEDTEDTRPVVVFLPGAGGDGPPMGDFRRSGDEFRWLTLGYPGWQQIVTAGMDADDIVAGLAEDVAGAGVHDPVHLAGMSSGAAFAYALAERLRGQGRTLAPVLIIDSAGRHFGSSRPSLLRRIRRRILDQLRTPTRIELTLRQALVHKVRSRLPALVYTHRNSRIVRRLAASRRPPLRLSAQMSQDTTVRFHAEYAVSAARNAAVRGRDEPVDVVLLRSSSTAWNWLPDDLGWGHDTHLIRIEHFDANHRSIVRGENGARIRQVLSELTRTPVARPPHGEHHDGQP